MTDGWFGEGGMPEPGGGTVNTPQDAVGVLGTTVIVAATLDDLCSLVEQWAKDVRAMNVEYDKDGPRAHLAVRLANQMGTLLNSIASVQSEAEAAKNTAMAFLPS
jgi:hypothetical protein